MIDQLLREAEQKYRQGQRYYQAQAAEQAVAHYHDGLELLLRWCLIRDGAPPTRVTDPQQVTWQDLVMYLDARYGVEREACIFLSQMTHLREGITAGRHPELNSLTMQGYTQLVNSLFRRFFPRSAEEREQVAQRGTFGRPQPVADLTAMPLHRAHDTPIMVPTQPAAVAPPPLAAATAPPITIRPAWADELLNSGSHPGPNPPPPFPIEEGGGDGVGGAQPAPAITQNLERSTQHAEHSTPRSAADNPQSAIRNPQSTEQRAREAGQRLREMRINGLEYCPRCRNTITMTAPTCPYCKFDMAAFRAFSRQPAGRDTGLLDKILRRFR